MAESATIARPYAQAVFRLAKDEGDLAAWSERLQRLAAIAADPDMERVTGNPEFSARRVTVLFMSLTGEPENRELASFVDLLAENGRFGVLSEISAIYESLKDEDEGVKEAAVTSAFPLSEAELAALLRKARAALRRPAARAGQGRPGADRRRGGGGRRPDLRRFGARQARGHERGAQELGERRCN